MFLSSFPNCKESLVRTKRPNPKLCKGQKDDKKSEKIPL